MKKFKFSLDGVLSYKQQILDVLQGEHGAIVAQVHAQEKKLTDCWSTYRRCNSEYCGKTEAGLPITEALMYQSRLRAMEREIQQETSLLEELRKKEEEKRAEVVEAKKESTSIEKLKEKKLAAYQKEEAKGEEQFIEEFVATSRMLNASI